MFLSGFVRPSVWMSIFRANKKGIEGNLKGEGRLLGGTVPFFNKGSSNKCYGSIVNFKHLAWENKRH